MVQSKLDIPLNENIDFLVENEMAAEILWTLAVLKSLNLQKMSQIIGKKPASILHNVKRLDKRGLIKLDVQATKGKPGKFYNLSKKGYKLLDRDIFEFYNQNEQIINNYVLQSPGVHKGSIDLEILSQVAKMRSITSNIDIIMSKIRTNFLQYNVNELEVNDGNLIYKGEDMNGVAGFHRINIEDPNRHKKVIDLFFQFNQEVKKIIKEYRDEDNLIFEKTGKNPNSLAETKKFLHVRLIAIPVIVES